MNKLEIQSYLKRDKELFKKCDIEYVINNSSKITVNNIYNLKLDEKLFAIDNICNDNYYSVFIVIIKKNNNEILQTKVFNQKFDSNQININITKIKNQEVLEEYYFLISIIPTIKENKELLSKLVKIFYDPIIGKSKDFILNNKLGILSTIILFFSLSFSLLQTNITNQLINNYGFVDNLINHISISNSMVLYFYENFFLQPVTNLLLFILFILFLLGIFFISFFYFLLIYFKLIFIKIIFCNRSNLDIKIELLKTFLDMKANIKGIFFDINFSIYALISSSILFLLIFIPLLSIFSEANIKNNLNFTGKIIERYFEFSKFPAFVKIKELNTDEEDVLLIGYDNVYTYYYDKKYIDKELMNIFKDFKKNEYNSREMPVSEIYSYYLKDKLLKEELKLIRNIDYIIKEELKSNYYEIIKKNK